MHTEKDKKELTIEGFFRYFSFFLNSWLTLIRDEGFFSQKGLLFSDKNLPSFDGFHVSHQSPPALAAFFSMTSDFSRRLKKTSNELKGHIEEALMGRGQRVEQDSCQVHQALVNLYHLIYRMILINQQNDRQLDQRVINDMIDGAHEFKMRVYRYYS